VFTADLSASGVDDLGEGVFLGGPGGLSNVIHEGQAAPGGGTFGGFGSFSPDTINNSGDVAFGFGLDPFTMPLGANAGVYRYNHATQQVTAVLVPGVTPAPGGGLFQGTLFHPYLNDGGDLVFVGLVPTSIGPGGAAGLGSGIFVSSANGTITKVVRPGDAAGFGSATNVFDFTQNPSINNRGAVAFSANLDNGKQAVFVWSHGSLTQVAQTGTVIPGVGTIASFDQYGTGLVDSYVRLNDRGQVAFGAALVGGSAALILGTPRGNHDADFDPWFFAAPTVATGSGNNGGQPNGNGPTGHHTLPPQIAATVAAAWASGGTLTPAQISALLDSMLPPGFNNPLVWSIVW
jgi:hypothetical protein